MASPSSAETSSTAHLGRCFMARRGGPALRSPLSVAVRPFGRACCSLVVRIGKQSRRLGRPQCVISTRFDSLSLRFVFTLAGTPRLVRETRARSLQLPSSNTSRDNCFNFPSFVFLFSVSFLNEAKQQTNCLNVNVGKETLSIEQ